MVAIAGISFATPAMADFVKARCDVYPKGSDQLEKMIPCTFGQRHGAVTITRDDGVVHDLAPVGDDPGNYRDASGRAAYRQSGLGESGVIFRLADESVYVYWDTSALNKTESVEENWTAPFTTADYDATTRLRCKAAGDKEFGSCPAGIARMDGGQASITVQNQLGKQFTVNFMKDYINAANRKVDARLEGDTWIVTVDDGEVYEVPVAAIEGG